MEFFVLFSIVRDDNSQLDIIKLFAQNQEMVSSTDIIKPIFINFSYEATDIVCLNIDIACLLV